MSIRKSAPSVLNRIQKATPDSPHENAKSTGKKGAEENPHPLMIDDWRKKKPQPF
jgi:hypothetical protein